MYKTIGFCVIHLKKSTNINVKNSTMRNNNEDRMVGK